MFCALYLPVACGDGVGTVDGRNGLDQEGDNEVGEAEVEEEQVGGGGHQLVVVTDCGHHQQVRQNA